MICKCAQWTAECESKGRKKGWKGRGEGEREMNGKGKVEDVKQTREMEGMKVWKNLIHKKKKNDRPVFTVRRR